MKIALDRLHSELTKRSSRSYIDSAQYFRSAVDALRKLRGTANSAVRLDCLRRCFVFFFQHGEAALALDAADQHEALSQRTGDVSSLRLSYSLRGVVLADVGNLTEALFNYCVALQLAQECGDRLGECMVMNNIGIAMNYAGLYHDAETCFLRVVELARDDGKYRTDKSALSNLAQSYLHLGEPRKALSAIDQCMDYAVSATNTPDPSALTIREFTYVRIALELGWYEVAKRRAERCRQHAYAADAFRCKAMADIASGLCDVCDGNIQRGLRRLEATLAASPRIDSIHSDAILAIVKAYDNAGQPQDALRHMEMWVSQVRERRSKSLQTALALQGQSQRFLQIADDGRDLRDLEYKTSNLRLKVAEQHAAASHWELLERLAVTADLREDNSGQHGYRVGTLSRLLAGEVGLEPESAKAIELAARLHDFGKTGIPERVLGSSESLKDAERQLMKLHTVIGAELLAKSNLPEIKLAEQIARHHHEWWDGSGYPDKLAGKGIPIHARIVALADVLDALTHGRPYAEPWSIDRALEEIHNRRGTQFDPALTDRFVAMVGRLNAEHADLDAYLGMAGLKSPLLQARKRIRGLLNVARVCESEPVLP